jgi:hypothetical protein
MISGPCPHMSWPLIITLPLDWHWQMYILRLSFGYNLPNFSWYVGAPPLCGGPCCASCLAVTGAL